MTQKDLPLIAFEKVLKREGAIRISKEALQVFCDEIEKDISENAHNARKYAFHANRKTIMQDDLRFVLKSD